METKRQCLRCSKLFKPTVSALRKWLCRACFEHNQGSTECEERRYTDSIQRNNGKARARDMETTITTWHYD